MNIECPICSKDKQYYMGPERKYRGPMLRCTEKNYSGCGVDITNCEECGKAYEISYMIDNVTRLDSDWDHPTREQEREYVLNAKRQQVTDLRKKADQLEKEVTL